MDSCLELELARNSLIDFTTATPHDQVTARHVEAMECRKCEEKIQYGIQAFKWLVRAEETIREALYRNLIPPTRDPREALHTLYTAWLEQFEGVSEKIARHKEAGYECSGAAELYECANRVQEWLSDSEWRSSAARANRANQEGEPW